MRPDLVSFLILAAAFVLFTGCKKQSAEKVQSWQLIYQNDYNGKPVSGSKEELISAMKRGSPIRVSWGGTEDDGRSWIEFATPVFTTIMNDTAVVVQFPLSFIQTSYTNPEESFLQTDSPTGWRAIMSTSGDYHQFHYDLKSGEVTREMYSRTNMSWFVLSSSRNKRPVPNLAPENAFKLDSSINR